MKKRTQLFGFHSLVMRRKYLPWRYALVCERLRCEPWRPWGWGETLNLLGARLQVGRLDYYV